MRQLATSDQTTYKLTIVFIDRRTTFNSDQYAFITINTWCEHLQHNRTTVQSLIIQACNSNEGQDGEYRIEKHGGNSSPKIMLPDFKYP